MGVLLPDNSVIKFIVPQNVSVGNLNRGWNITATVSQLWRMIRDQFPNEYLEGIDCRVLREYKPWQSGKFKLGIVFVADDDERELDHLDILGADDVIRFTVPAYFGNLSQGSDIVSTTYELWKKMIGNNLPDVFLEGMDCRVLMEYQPWQSGKFKMVIIFIADEKEQELDPLDQLRLAMKNT